MDDTGRQVALQVTVEDLKVLIGSVQQSLRYWEQHFQDDAGRTHSPQEYSDVRGGATENSFGGSSPSRCHAASTSSTALAPSPRLRIDYGLATPRSWGAW